MNRLRMTLTWPNRSMESVFSSVGPCLLQSKESHSRLTALKVKKNHDFIQINAQNFREILKI